MNFYGSLFLYVEVIKLKRCERCGEWNCKRKEVVELAKSHGFNMTAEGVDDYCVCDKMSKVEAYKKRKQEMEDRELLILRDRNFI